jgi:hypothetical protein
MLVEEAVKPSIYTCYRVGTLLQAAKLFRIREAGARDRNKVGLHQHCPQAGYNSLAQQRHDANRSRVLK